MKSEYRYSKPFLGLLMWLVYQAQVSAAADDPENTIIDFYKLVATHQCQEAALLANGYPVNSCKIIHSLIPPKNIIRVAAPNKGKAYLGYRVEYSRVNEPDRTYCVEVKTIRLTQRERWIIDWPTLQPAACPGSEPIPTAETPPAIPPTHGADRKAPTQPIQASDVPPPTERPVQRRTTVIPPPQTEAAPPPVASQPPEKSHWRLPWSDDAPPDEPSAPAMNPVVRSGHSDHLLGLWSPEDLLGHPGDERIINVRPPDITPPQRRQPKEQLPEVRGKLADSIRRVRLPEGKKLVALTFDLCEQADDRTGYDRQIVNYLRQQKLPATFFAGGKWLRSHEDKALQLMADPLFEIGNHGWTHGNLRVMRGQRMVDQIAWTQAEYNRLWDMLDRKAKAAGLDDSMRAIPRQPQTLRFPYGTCDATSLRAANQLGLSAIQWDVVSGDAAPKSTPDGVARAVLGGVKPGSIIVFHANGRGHGTAGALPRIVESLRAKGYEFATVSNLLRAGEPDAVSQCYEMRPGDNLYIDAKFGEGTGER